MSTYIDEKTGSIKHEKYKPIPEQIVCSKCGVGYIYSGSPLIKGEDAEGNKNYTCKNCLGI